MMNMSWFVPAVFVFFAGVVQAESETCIAVSDNSIEKLSSEYGITTAEWTAHVKNSCDDAYDATLTVQFVNDAGDVLYESLEVVILNRRDSEDTRLRVTLPSESYDRIARIRVNVEERKRPI